MNKFQISILGVLCRLSFKPVTDIGSKLSQNTQKKPFHVVVYERGRIHHSMYNITSTLSFSSPTFSEYHQEFY